MQTKNSIWSRIFFGNNFNKMKKFIKSLFEHLYFYKQVQSFRVHCLFTGQFYTEDYVTFADVKKITL